VSSVVGRNAGAQRHATGLAALVSRAIHQDAGKYETVPFRSRFSDRLIRRRVVFRKFFTFRGDNDKAWQRAERFVSEEARERLLESRSQQ
jgi:hypothetical protein